MNGVTLIAVGILSGLYTCSWGAFKDGPWEGFNGRTFPRSVIFSLLAVELLWLWPATRNHLWLLSPFQLFFLVMGIERTWSEIFKWSFRAPRSDADRFAIPQQLTFFGKPVKAWLRGLVGAVLTVALVAGLLGFGGVAGASIEIAKIIFFVAIVLFLVSAVFGIFRGRTRV